MNFKKKALLPAIAMVLVSVIALTGVSYAWFTMSNEATVNELALDVKVAEGMQISVDGASWKSNLTNEDITSNLTGYQGNVNQIPATQVVPVSSPCTVDADGHLVMFNGSIVDGKLVTEAVSDVKGTEGNYYAFDLFFNMSAAKTLKLDAGSYVSASNGAQTNYAARVAFIYLGAADTGLAAQALKTSQGTMIWEPAATKHTASAVAANNAINNTKVDYKGVDAESTDFDMVNGGAAVTTTAIGETAEGATNTATTLFSFAKGINKVRVYIWLEGQDVDCLNDISGNKFNTFFKFTQA